MQKHSTKSPGHQANVKHHHEKLKFTGLKEKQHLGRNYYNLKGGCRPVYKSEIWKQCLIFFFFKLVCIPVMRPWCECPNVRSKIVESELSLGGGFFPSAEPY